MKRAQVAAVPSALVVCGALLLCSEVVAAFLGPQLHHHHQAASPAARSQSPWGRQRLQQPPPPLAVTKGTESDAALVYEELEKIADGTRELLDEASAHEAFLSVVAAVDRAEAQDEPLPASVPVALHRVFDADVRLLLEGREKVTTNCTCLKPEDDPDDAGAARRMNYVFDDSDIKNLPLTEGRRCEGGECSCACSRNIFPTFCGSDEERRAVQTNVEAFPGLTSFSFNDVADVPAATILQFVRLIERVRRVIAFEYGLPLKTILPLQAYSRKYVAVSTQQGGGGGEGDFVTLHCDEATHTGYHYSCVIYLSTHGVDFEGGAFVFNDPSDEAEDQDDEEEDEDWDAPSLQFNYTALAEKIRSGEYVPPIADGEAAAAEDDDWLSDTSVSLEDYEQSDDFDDDFSDEQLESLTEEIRRAGRHLTPFYPTRGSAVIFSSGWENLHEVEKITSGVRYTVPCFFTTCPVPEAAYEQMTVGKPQSNEMIADDWLHLLLAHRQEKPIESVGRVKELLMKWHYLCTPLSEH